MDEEYGYQATTNHDDRRRVSDVQDNEDVHDTGYHDSEDEFEETTGQRYHHWFLRLLGRGREKLDETRGLLNPYRKHKVLEKEVRFTHYMRRKNAETRDEESVEDDLFPEKRVNVDLSFGMLDSVDLSDFPYAVQVNLSGNRLSSLKDSGLHKLPALKHLDISENNFSLWEVQWILEELPQLESIVLHGNPFSTKPQKGKRCALGCLGCLLCCNSFGESWKTYRFRLIVMHPELRRSYYKLRYIDGYEISPSEIADAWLYSGGSRHEVEHLRFDIVMKRQLLDHESLDRSGHPWSLELAGCKLRTLNFVPLENVTTLNLSENYISSALLEASDLPGNFPNLERLDLSNNSLTNYETLCETLHGFPVLLEVWLTGNPIMENNGFKSRNIFCYFFFLGHIFGSTLRHLNSKPITIAEIVKSQEAAFSDFSIRERIRLALTLERDNKGVMMKQSGLLNLRGCQLYFLGFLSNLQNIRYLDLSENRLEYIGGQGIGSLRRLYWLSLAKNKLLSLEGTVTELQGCHELSTLVLKDSCRSGTSNPEKYVEFVFSVLHGLHKCDDIENPEPLDQQQIGICEQLRAMGAVNVGPNSVANIDLSGLGLREEDMESVSSMLSVLPVRNLRCFKNPWTQAEGYRLQFISYIPDLHSFDDQIVDIRAHVAAVGFINDVVGERHRVLKEDRVNKVSEGAFENMHLSRPDLTKENTGDVELLVDAGCRASTLGNQILSRTEIALNFLQMLACLNMLNVNWPPRAEGLVSSMEIVNLEFEWYTRSIGNFEYMRYFLVISLPIILVLVYLCTAYKQGRDSTLEGRRSLRRQLNTSVIQCVACYACCLCVFGIWAFMYVFFYRPSDDYKVFDTGKFSDHRYSKYYMLLMVFFGGILTWLLCIFVTAYCAYGRGNFQDHRMIDDRYTAIGRIRNRVLLFLLMILYLPAVKASLLPFATSTDENGRCYLTYFSNSYCDSGSLGLPIIMIVSIIVTPFVVLGPLVLFGMLIYQGKRHVEDYFGLTPERQDLAENYQKHRGNVMFIKVLNMKWEAYSMKYRRAIQASNIPEAYLFNSYEAGHTYWKIFLMVEKVSIVLVFLCNDSWWQMFLASFIVVFMYFVSFVIRPYGSDVEDLMDSTARFTLAVNMVCAFMLVEGFAKPGMLYLIMICVNVVNGVLIAVVVGMTLLRLYFANCPFCINIADRAEKSMI